MASWVDLSSDNGFGLENLPYGIFSLNNDNPRPGIAIGEKILDLKKLASLGYLNDLNIDLTVFSSPVLNDYMSLGRAVWTSFRSKIQELLKEGSELSTYDTEVLVNQSDARMHLPVKIGDYTDFYSSKEHATNVGMMFRDPENALLPNWKHIPVGYHGRASSIYVSGTPIIRPNGQQEPVNSEVPIFGPCKLLDIELEMAFIIGKETNRGERVSTANATDHIFGLALFNDWSARDIQKWEYVPLGPFLGKNFASSLAPWIVPLEALEPFKVAGPIQDPKVLPYLEYEGSFNYDIDLGIHLKPKDSEYTTIAKSNYKYMYWNMAQQLAHHTINGCNLKVGDVMASGTISGKEKGSYGSMLELSWAGKETIPLDNGESRKFLQDYDTIKLTGQCVKDGVKVNFGEVIGQVHPAQ